MKTEWLATDVTSVGSPARAEQAVFGGVLGVFWPIQATFVIRKPLCDVSTKSAIAELSG